MSVLSKLLSKAVRKGRLQVTFPDGSIETFGSEPGPEVAIRIKDPSFARRIALNPELVAAEAFMDEALVVENPKSGTGAWELLEIFFLNKRHFDLTPSQIFWRGVARGAKRFMQHNPVSRARQNAKHHYDLGNDLYRLFLDRGMQYSCAYYPDGDETLEEAQQKKMRHIAAKLCLKPGQRVLDIGCGWGGLGLYLASVEDVEVVGVTLADEQLIVAQARVEAMGLSDRVRFELRDYRDVTESFDRVVSVGMLEHVGITSLTGYHLSVRDRLKPGGAALLHSISTTAPPGVPGPFIRKYIFPGGYAPSVSESVQAVEKSGLWITDMEVWRVHYAKTLREWRRRFEAERPQIEAMYDERFARMWEFYLAACEGVFEYGASMVYQMQLTRERDDVPLHRDYIQEEEARFAAKEPAFMEALMASAETALGDPARGEAAA
ncbi:MAG: class I SAM-dependent methyltransferase [Neomegalonema sp.]